MVTVFVVLLCIIHPSLDAGTHRAGWDLILPVSSVPGTAKEGISLSAAIGQRDWHRPGGHTGVKHIHPEGTLISRSLTAEWARVCGQSGQRTPQAQAVASCFWGGG